MFLETKVTERGWLEVIAGSMFSGKTEELIRRLRRAEIANQKVKIFKPAIDKRFSEEKVVSHDENSIDSIPVRHSADIPEAANGCDVVGIDEAQFFDDRLPETCNALANKGKRVIVAGLDMDFQGKPFGCMPELFAIAEYVTKVHAICMQCGHLAQYSHRLSPDDELVVLGEKDLYEPLCRKCFNASQQA